MLKLFIGLTVGIALTTGILQILVVAIPFIIIASIASGIYFAFKD